MFCSLPQGWVATIYLHPGGCPSALSFQRTKIPLPNLGFSLAGFIAFHSAGFPADSVTVTLLKISSIASLQEALGFDQPSAGKLPGLMNWTGTNTTVIADCASMDFPLILVKPAIARIEIQSFCLFL